MQTHRDEDFDTMDGGMKDMFENLMKRAEQMTAQRENLITAGEEDEKPLRSWSFRNNEVRKLPDDPDGVLRVSIGGVGDLSYLVYRGDKKKCRALISRVAAALDARLGD